MSRKAVECHSCGAEYTIIYDPEDMESDPKICPFCGEASSLDDAEEDDIDLGEWDE